MEPIAIATLAFIGTKVAETLVEKFTEVALPKANNLRQKLWDKLRGNGNAEIALQGAENGSQADLEAVADYLKIAMREDPQFAEEVNQLAQEIEEERKDKQTSITQIIRDNAKGYQNNSNNYGGTTNNINEQTINNYNYPPQH